MMHATNTNTNSRCVWLASLWVCCAIAAGPANAQDRKLTGPEIKALLTDRVAHGKEDSGSANEQLFLASGATFYSVGAAQSQGRWEVRGNQYCSAWPPSTSWSCYDVTHDGATHSFLSAAGKRYRVVMR